jgi:hypothetical protein
MSIACGEKSSLRARDLCGMLVNRMLLGINLPLSPFLSYTVTVPIPKVFTLSYSPLM